MSVIRLQIPASAEYLDLVRLSLYGVASKMGFSYEDIEDLKVAVSEACNNAILHGEPQIGNGQIEISYEFGEGFLRVKVKDDGTGYETHDPNRQTGPFSGTSPSELQTGGLGIYLMQALMDEVEIDTQDGTEVTLVKYVQTKTTD
ncbi:anti-sigma B factor RsbW [Paenibacillus qinlingensis]|uniref:Serine/threonine-protein kinase RsbW n=1 Tax=Paenibacillus qinlingensis TaxID=1837343 RepID=A0ABU1P3J3_9BACL|nr:anti-sigma B factor RsbW [Paenibacillus qinlingensis]MDR6554306.1 serine/threonine-protein kinase RsbW [Paenibacillus qinlingensis]